MKVSTSVLIGILSVCYVVNNGCKKSEDKILISSSPSDGQMLIAPITGGNTSYGELQLLDKYGITIAAKQVGADAYNLQKWEVNGKTRFTYLEHDLSAVQIAPPSIVPCRGVIMDEHFNELKRVSLLPYNGRTADDPSSIDAHEFIYLDDNHFITLSYFQKPVNNIPASLNPVANCKVVAPIIQEVLNDQVVWEWDGSNYPEFYQQSVEGNAFNNANVVHDYMHLNSIFIDSADNNLICSIRNLNQVIKINRTTGNIMWRLGGSNSDFAMTPDMKFLRQHHATLTDNNQTLLIYDDGEITERPYTRIVEFQLNEHEKNITSFKPFNLPNHIFSQFMGSVQKRGDTYFVGCGTDPEIMEVNYNTGKINFLMKLTKSTYRAFKY